MAEESSKNKEAMKILKILFGTILQRNLGKRHWNRSINELSGISCLRHAMVQGVPEHTSEDATLKICLQEIDRCKEDNIMPYFLNMVR